PSYETAIVWAPANGQHAGGSPKGPLRQRWHPCVGEIFSVLVKYSHLGRDFRHALRQEGTCLKLRGTVLAPVLLALSSAATLCEAAERKTENVILITLDG